MIDLHCHSTASDGSFTPTQLVSLAEECGLKALALTDHDTLDGLGEFRRAGENSPVECIPGIELASQDAENSYAGYHIVGLFLGAEASEEMQELMQRCIEAREARNLAILERLRHHGIELSLTEVESAAGGEVIGRPHIAQALVNRGVVSSIQCAFDRYLGSGKPAYVRRRLPSPETAIAAIHSMGGVAIWAHPFTRGNYTVRRIHEMAVHLKGIGLDGMEAYYALHTVTQVKNALEICEDVGLLPSGGSDFHGAVTRSIRLGVGTGKLNVPDSILADLEACRDQRASAR